LSADKFMVASSGESCRVFSGELMEIPKSPSWNWPPLPKKW
jgi:hypothetical protein